MEKIRHQILDKLDELSLYIHLCCRLALPSDHESSISS